MLWFWQTVQGVLCLFLGIITMSYEAPFPPADNGTLTGWTMIDSTWVPLNSTDPDFNSQKYLIQHCGSQSVMMTPELRNMLSREFSSIKTSVVISEPPAPWGNGDDCISNQLSFGLVVLILFAFSVAVQMAEGLTFGIVPLVSRPALGVVNGMVGAGGNLGSVITLSLFFHGSNMRTDVGIFYTGIVTIIVTMLLFLVYFPEQGGILFRAGSLKYDPQRIKPPKNYRGADSITYSSEVKEAATHSEGKSSITHTNESSTTHTIEVKEATTHSEPTPTHSEGKSSIERT
jgi:NNP family nitrate/nitrite transporter-like MFS transporter